ncbi:putative amyloid protein-binding protein, partial [Trypoxylus dichotomus]
MAMVLSSQSKLLVALCFTLLILAGALAIGSLTGWFHPKLTNDPVPARLRQIKNRLPYCLVLCQHILYIICWVECPAPEILTADTGKRNMSSDQFPSLYCLCLKIAVVDCANSCKFCKKEFRLLPDNVLFDFYHKMCLEKRLCLLGLEFSNLDVFKRMLKIKHKRRDLLKMFQILTDHCSNVTELVLNYIKYINSDDPCIEMIDFGLRLGGFFKEGGWYPSAIEVLNAVEGLCKKMELNTHLLLKLLDCYYKRIYVECYYCITKAEETMNSILAVIKQLQQHSAVPNLSGLYANFATMYFLRSEYEQAYNWSKKALRLLNEDLPKRTIVDVLRQASKSCVVKRHFAQAELLIKQAMSLASQAYAIDKHPRYSDTLMDYGFFLLNSDFIQESVRVYERALTIRKEVFEKYNILVAIGHEDLAYAQYVNEYSSGQFYSPR